MPQNRLKIVSQPSKSLEHHFEAPKQLFELQNTPPAAGRQRNFGQRVSTFYQHLKRRKISQVPTPNINISGVRFQQNSSSLQYCSSRTARAGRGSGARRSRRAHGSARSQCVSQAGLAEHAQPQHSTACHTGITLTRTLRSGVGCALHLFSARYPIGAAHTSARPRCRPFPPAPVQANRWPLPALFTPQHTPHPPAEFLMPFTRKLCQPLPMGPSTHGTGAHGESRPASTPPERRTPLSRSKVNHKYTQECSLQPLVPRSS